ncbi:MAG: hypothetical protein AB1449_01340 [Chloroflexota bacterium]
MPSQMDGLMNDVRIVNDLGDQALTRAEALIRWVLLVGFLAVLSTEVWLLWRAWDQLF